MNTTLNIIKVCIRTSFDTTEINLFKGTFSILISGQKIYKRKMMNINHSFSEELIKTKWQ